MGVRRRRRLVGTVGAACSILAVAACTGGSGDETSADRAEVSSATIDIEFSGSGAGEADDGLVEPSLDSPADSANDDEYVLVASATSDVVVAHEQPDGGSPVVTELPNPTKVGGPLAFQVVGEDADATSEWLEVYLPIRPNGSTGWVRRQDVTLSSNPYRIEIDTSEHFLTVFKAGEVWVETPVAIGTGETPTPIGSFYVIELLEPPDSGGAYGPFAFGLSGFSETLTNFAGGDGVIGIHGTNDPGSLGGDVSHGCVRMANDVISELAGVLPLGTPVVISA